MRRRLPGLSAMTPNASPETLNAPTQSTKGNGMTTRALITRLESRRDRDRLIPTGSLSNQRGEENHD